MQTQTTRQLLAASFLVLILPLLVTAQSSPSLHTADLPEYTFKILRVFPHDPAAFTQGLAYRDGFLYEGTGRNGQSSLRKVVLETGKVIQRADLTSEFSGRESLC